MAYCTLEEIQKHLPAAAVAQLTKDPGDDADEAETLTGERVTEAIGRADAIIDGFLSTRDLVLPLDPVPTLIKAISIDLAIWALHSRKAALELPKPVQQRYDNALKLLGQIQAGKLGWGAQEADPNSPAEYHTDARTTDRIFPKSVLDKY